jgi:hypothetical protein
LSSYFSKLYYAHGAGWEGHVAWGTGPSLAVKEAVTHRSRSNLGRQRRSTDFTSSTNSGVHGTLQSARVCFLPSARSTTAHLLCSPISLPLHSRLPHSHLPLQRQLTFSTHRPVKGHNTVFTPAFFESLNYRIRCGELSSWLILNRFNLRPIRLRRAMPLYSTQRKRPLQHPQTRRSVWTQNSPALTQRWRYQCQ